MISNFLVENCEDNKDRYEVNSWFEEMRMSHYLTQSQLLFFVCMLNKSNKITAS